MTADEFRAIRLKLGLRQVDLAEKLGAGYGSVRNWESGRYHVPGPVAVLMRQLARKADQ